MPKREGAEHTPEEKEHYRKSCLLSAYDKALIARNLIADAYHRAYPHALRRLPPDGICHCQNPISHGDIKLMLDAHGHEYHSHQNCKSWACPICAPKRAYARARELEKALLSANEKGYKQFFVTFTVPHTKKHTSRHVIDLLNACYRRFTNAHAIRRLKAEHGYVGAIKCLDYTITDNGTHAHLHTVWIFEDDAELHELGARIAPVFLKVWERQVRNASSKKIHQRYGFNFECMELSSNDAEAIAKYAAKSISIYCTDGDKSKEGSVTPFDLLSPDATDEQKAQYVDFYRGQKGRRHIMFSPGLKERLDIADDDDSRAATAVIAYLKYEHAFYLKNESARQEFESRASSSVADALDWLENETAKQQAALRRRYPISAHGIALPLDLGIVRDQRAIDDIDDNRSAFADCIFRNNERQNRFRELITKESYVSRSISFPADDCDGSHIHRNENRTADKPPLGRPQSGLGAFLAKAIVFVPMPSVAPCFVGAISDNDDPDFWF